MSLKGKVALVTGAASGLGRECVLNMAAKGAKVVIADLSLENGNLVVDDIKKAGGEDVVLDPRLGFCAVEAVGDVHAHIH